MRRRWFPLFVSAVALAGACASDSGPVESPFDAPVAGAGSRTTLLPPAPTDPPQVEGPSLGELSLPCGRGSATASAAVRSQVGVDTETIAIGTGNDRGGLYSVGSGRGMPDAVEVMADHCNSLGGLLGRDVRVLEYDAAVVEVVERSEAQCEEVVAVVGQGYQRSDDAVEARQLCGLPSFPGWVDDLTVGDPVVLLGFLHALLLEPAAERVALVAPDTSNGIRDSETRAEALLNSTVDASVVAVLSYPVDEIADWAAIAQAVRDAEAGLVRIDGACESAVVPMLRSFGDDEAPPLLLAGPSAYDAACIAAAALEGLPVDRLLIELPFLPVEDGGAAPVTASYVELLGNIGVEPTGDALMASSAFWRFAAAADACGSQLGRACLTEASTMLGGWTAGLLHRTLGSGRGSDACVVIVGVESSGVDAGGFVRRVPDEPGVYDCDPSLSGAPDD